MDIDEALALVGGYRRWHLTIFILLGVSCFLPLAWQGLSLVFTGWEPAHHCYVNDTSGNLSAYIPIIKEENGNVGMSKCTMYANSSVNVTTTCTNGWTYDNEGYYTIVEQWDLVCERNYISELSQTTYQVGCLFAEVVFSYLVDRYGRKMVHIVSHLAICVTGIALAFSNNYITFIVLRTIIGMLSVANINSGLTQCMELFDSTRRAVAGIGLEFQWIFCYLTLPLLTFFIVDWRILQIVMSLSSAIWIIYFWILPESPIWLVAVGRYDEAEKLLHKIAKWNGVPVDPKTRLLSIPPRESVPCQPVNDPSAKMITFTMKEDEKTGELIGGFVPAVSIQSLSTAQQKKQQEVSVPVASLLKDKYLRLYIIIFSILWLANCLVYYALILSIPTLAGNRFINFLIMGLVELPATFLALYTTQRFGRRIPTSVYHIAAGIPLTIVMFIPKTTATGVSLTPLIITLVMVSKFAISASFSVVLLYTKELFPTNLRGTSSGICQVLGRIGAIFAPLAAYAPKTSYYWLPNFVFGIIAIVAGLATLVLPETSGHPLPQTIEDIHLMATSKSRDSSAKDAKYKTPEAAAAEVVSAEGSGSGKSDALLNNTNDNNHSKA